MSVRLKSGRSAVRYRPWPLRWLFLCFVVYPDGLIQCSDYPASRKVESTVVLIGQKLPYGVPVTIE